MESLIPGIITIKGLGKTYTLSIDINYKDLIKKYDLWFIILILDWLKKLMISFKKILNNFDEFEKELDGEYSEEKPKDASYIYI